MTFGRVMEVDGKDSLEMVDGAGIRKSIGTLARDFESTKQLLKLPNSPA
jgi:hypothetical protein